MNDKQETKKLSPSRKDTSEVMDIVDTACNSSSSTAVPAPTQSQRNKRIDLIQATTATNLNMRLLALQELNEILCMAREEEFSSSSGINLTLLINNLISQLNSFPESVDSFDLDLYPEVLLMSCRCLFNLVEANPSAILRINSANGIQVLVNKLMQIEYIDLAEQILRILERISQEFPRIVLTTNALLAVLQYLDFFSIHVQRTSLRIVSNLMHGLPPSGPTLQDYRETIFDNVFAVIDILVNLLTYADQKIVDEAAASINRIAVWTSKDPAKLTKMFLKSNVSKINDKFIDSINSKQYKIGVLLSRTLENFCKSPQIRHVLLEEFDFLKSCGKMLQIVKENHLSKEPTEICVILVDLISNLMPQIPIVELWRVNAEVVESTIVSESADSAIVQNILVDIFPQLIESFITTSSNQIHRKTLLCICRAIWFCSSDELLWNTLDNQRNFNKFIFEVLNASENIAKDHSGLSFTLAGLCIIHHLTSRKGNGFQECLVREGLKTTLESIALKAKHGPNSNDTEKDDKLFLASYIKYKNKFLGIELENDDDSNTEKMEIGNDAIEKMVVYIERKKICGWTAELFHVQQLRFKIYMECEIIMDELNKAQVEWKRSSTHLKTLETSEETIAKVCTADELPIEWQLVVSKELDNIGNLITATNEGNFHNGLTSYELFHSSVILFLVDFLTSHSVNETHVAPFIAQKYNWKVPLSTRISIFRGVFGAKNTTTNMSYFEAVVGRLMEYIGRIEKYQIRTTNTPYSYMHPTGSSYQNLSNLTRQLRLCLKADSECDIPDDLRTFTVVIPAIATFRTLEDYIQSRLSQSSSVSSGSPRIMDILDLEEDEDEQLNQASSIANIPTLDILFDQETALFITKEEYFTSRRNESSIRFEKDGQQVNMEDTILKVLYDQDPLNFDFKSVWEVTHSLSFSKTSTRDTSPTVSKNLPIPRLQNQKVKVNYCCEICDDLYLQLRNFHDEFNPPELRYPMILLSVLYLLNESAEIRYVDYELFRNARINRKLEKQLEEPLICISRLYPSWVWALVWQQGFLFTFDNHLRLFKSSAMCQSKNISNWMSCFRLGSGNLQNHASVRNGKLKLRVGRENSFESFVKFLETNGSIFSTFEIEFIDEVGSGLGPTVEYFSIVSLEIRNRTGLRLNPLEKRLPVWRSNGEIDEYINSQNGLYPNPISGNSEKVQEIFRVLGIFVAKCIMDNRRLDLVFHPLFLMQVFHYKQFEPAPSAGLDVLKLLDSNLYTSLKYLLEIQNEQELMDLTIDYTLPGYPDYNLCLDGSKREVLSTNVVEYVTSVIDATIGRGVNLQIESFRDGFNEVIPVDFLNAFRVKDIEIILYGEQNENWSMEVLGNSIKPDHGYSSLSPTISTLLQMLNEFGIEERRNFLKFCTGSPRLPIGGFAALNPPLTIVRKNTKDPDTCLPSVMTCAHYLKVPEYSSRQVMESKFLVAIKEGQGSFHLS